MKRCSQRVDRGSRAILRAYTAPRAVSLLPAGLRRKVLRTESAATSTQPQTQHTSALCSHASHPIRPPPPPPPPRNEENSFSFLQLRPVLERPVPFLPPHFALLTFYGWPLVSPSSSPIPCFLSSLHLVNYPDHGPFNEDIISNAACRPMILPNPPREGNIRRKGEHQARFGLPGRARQPAIWEVAEPGRLAPAGCC